MNTKLMKWMGSLIVGLYGIFGIINIIQIDIFPVNEPGFGEYSIYSSTEFFWAYNIWGTVLAAVTIYGMWKEIRVFFMVGFFLLGVHMLYFSFTSVKTDTPAAKPNTEEVVPESTPAKPSNQPVEAPPMDQLMPDSTPVDSNS